MKKAFTLAEILIVLAVIGVITAILLPAARHATPDENVLKFKKANNTFLTAIRELVMSDKYCLDGDLGIKPDGSRVNSPTYFCESLADVLNVKSVNCSTVKLGSDVGSANNEARLDVRHPDGSDYNLSVATVDSICASCASTVGAEIILEDDVVFYQTSPGYHFGIEWTDWHYHFDSIDNPKARLFGSNFHVDSNGFDGGYKPFCIDIDGIGVGEDPFGYGIRADGKILYGTRASEWLKKSIQNKD